MTRRITLAILLSVWAILVVGCASAYLIVRWALVRQLDASLVVKASSAPELARVPLGPTTRASMSAAAAQPARTPRATAADDPRADRYVIKADNGVSLSPTAGGLALTDVTPLGGWFSELADGKPMRNVYVRGVARTPDGRPIGVTVTYSADASFLFGLLDRLALAFGA
ncbi:MAG TPA: hypothetical protein VH475_26800, partial [Tepidisphaeraceae bacterium]